MPAISTMVYPAPAYVRVEVGWGDQPQATGAAVYRVDCLTGARVPLRPYVSFDGDFLDLSCGYAVFWDTEPQLDRCIYYCTQAMNPDGSIVSTAAAPQLLYTFSTNVVDGWGPADTGETFTLNGGTNPGNYDVTGGVGTQTNDTVNALRHAWADAGSPDTDTYLDHLVPIGSAAGAAASSFHLARLKDTANYYLARLQVDTGGNVVLAAGKREGGSLVIFTSGTVGSGHASTDWWTTRLQVWGNQIKVKAWPRTGPEPDAWTQTFTSTADTFTGTNVGAASRLETGNLNGTVAFTYDNLRAYDPCVTTSVIELCSPSLVVPSSGDFRLGDPVRPCNDVVLKLDAEIDPDCVPTQGIFFGNMADESASANSSTFAPINAKYGIFINRTRGALSSTLTVASKTFADRDALRRLNAPGSLLQLRGPAQYGIYDRYMGVGEVTEVRPVPDHRVQPRMVSLPHLEFARPSGPSTGVCGTRVEDLCDIYPTWDAMIAAGLTYVDLLRGAASNETPLPASVERDWAEVLSDFTDWTGVNNNNTDWGDVLDGDA